MRTAWIKHVAEGEEDVGVEPLVRPTISNTTRFFSESATSRTDRSSEAWMVLRREQAELAHPVVNLAQVAAHAFRSGRKGVP